MCFSHFVVVELIHRKLGSQWTVTLQPQGCAFQPLKGGVGAFSEW